MLAEDHNTVLADGDIAAHPEQKLARWAARELDRATAAATTMYTSCQPCPMCTGAIDRSGLGRVVYALSARQFAERYPASVAPSVPQEGPACTTRPSPSSTGTSADRKRRPERALREASPE